MFPRFSRELSPDIDFHNIQYSSKFQSKNNQNRPKLIFFLLRCFEVFSDDFGAKNEGFLILWRLASKSDTS
jgi:hypothetical protein